MVVYTIGCVAAFANNAAWSGNSLGWKQATYNTSALGGSTYIRYAFVFKSDVNLSGDGVSIDDFALTSVVGLNELNTSTQLLVQPNPASNYLNVALTTLKNDFCNGDQLTLKIVDVEGKELMKQNVVCQNNLISERINVSSLASGIYFIKLQTTKAVSVQKFVKQ